MDSARYRMVHFVVSPFLDHRVPIAVLVECNGKTTVVPVEPVGCESCMGRSSIACARMALDDLAIDPPSFDSLPPSVGPQVLLGTERSLPGDFVDPIAWVTRLVREDATNA